MSTKFEPIIKSYKLPPEPWAGWMDNQYKCRVKSVLPKMDVFLFFYPWGYPSRNGGLSNSMIYMMIIVKFVIIITFVDN